MGTMVLPDALTIESVGAIRPALLAALAQSPDGLQLDGRSVTDLDGAGVQLLISTAKEAGLQGLMLSLRPSDFLQATLDLLAITDRFASVDDEPEGAE